MPVDENCRAPRCCLAYGKIRTDMETSKMHGIEPATPEYSGQLRRQSRLIIVQQCQRRWSYHTADELRSRIPNTLLKSNHLVKSAIIRRPAPFLTRITHFHKCYRTVHGQLSRQVIIPQAIA